MAELDEPADENIIENRSRNNILFAVELLTSHSVVWHITVWHPLVRAQILLIVNIILTDGIRMFLNTLTKK